MINLMFINFILCRELAKLQEAVKSRDMEIERLKRQLQESKNFPAKQPVTKKFKTHQVEDNGAVVPLSGIVYSFHH
jgi:dTDP-4-amino-4,6-dideoxygalactose transaminase